MLTDEPKQTRLEVSMLDTKKVRYGGENFVNHFFNKEIGIITVY